MAGDEDCIVKSTKPVQPAVRNQAVVGNKGGSGDSPERRDVLLAGGWIPTDRTTFVEGGERRQDSVRAGFEAP